MKSFTADLENESEENKYFRKVLYTDKNCQLVLMSLLAGEDIGEEVHDLDQFIRVEDGEGKSILDGEERSLIKNSIVVIPKGTRHNIMNTTSERHLKLSTLYTTESISE